MLTKLASDAFGQPSMSLGDLAVVSVFGGLLSSVLVLLITVALSGLSYRLRWDLDAVSTPMVTALGDMTTIPSLFLATALLGHGAATGALAVAAIGVAAVVGVRGFLARDRRVRRILIEMAATIAVTPVLDVAAGGLQEARLPELTLVPVLLALIPPFVSQAGALGGIFSSRISSKLQVGVITARGRPGAPAVVDAGITVVLSIAVFLAIGAIAWVLGAATGLPGMPSAPALIGGHPAGGYRPDADHARGRLLPGGRHVPVRAGPGQPGRADHHERDGPGGRRLRPVRHDIIGGPRPWMKNDRTTSRTCSSS